MTGEMDSDYYLGELTLSRDVLLHFLQSLPKRKNVEMVVMTTRDQLCGL